MTQTLFLLMAQFGARAVVPLDDVRKEFFNHLDSQAFLRKLVHSDIPFPVVRIEKSKKSAKGIHMVDLAIYIDAQRQQAEKERSQLVNALKGSDSP